MKDKLPTVTDDGKCFECGGEGMLLAVDHTTYTPYVFYNGQWMDGGSDTEVMSSDDPLGNVRFYCAACGAYHQVPEEFR